MKKEIEIPLQKQEDLVAAGIRRDNYSQNRDLQAAEYNSAIASRLKVKVENSLKCDKCGKEFTTLVDSGFTKCTECR